MYITYNRYKWDEKKKHEANEYLSYFVFRPDFPSKNKEKEFSSRNFISRNEKKKKYKQK